MAGSDYEQDETNVFFLSGFLDPKRNLLSRHSFEKVVVDLGMSDAHYPRYPMPMDADPENPRSVCLPQVVKETIFMLQINVGLRFPYCSDLVEMCSHCISPTQLSPNAIRTLVSFQVLCLSSMRLAVLPLPFFGNFTGPNFKTWPWNYSHPLVSEFQN